MKNVGLPYYIIGIAAVLVMMSWLFNLAFASYSLMAPVVYLGICLISVGLAFAQFQNGNRGMITALMVLIAIAYNPFVQIFDFVTMSKLQYDGIHLATAALFAFLAYKQFRYYKDYVNS